VVGQTCPVRNSFKLVQSEMMNKSTRKSASRRRRGVAQPSGRPFGDGDVVTKRMTYPGGFISSNGANVIVVTTVATAADVQSLPASEWASFAARYQQYRVKSVRAILEPLYPGSSTPTNASTGHNALYVADYIGTAAPGTAAQVLSDEGAVVINTSRKVDFKTTWARNPNARLWNPTSAALPAANSYAIAVASNTALALVASTDYFTVTMEWEVEFRGSQ